MSVKGVDIPKVAPSATAAVGDLRVSGFILNAVAVADKFNLNQAYKVNSLSDAENILGLDAAYDTANKVLVHHHISEFYAELSAQGIEGTTLWLYGVAQDQKLEQMVDPDGVHGKALIDGSEGEVFRIGVFRNPTAPYAPTITDGVDDDLIAAIPKAQALVDWAFSKMYPTRIFLEGRNFAPLPANQDLRDITNVNAPNVHVVVGQDFDVAEADALFNSYAAVGTIVGTRAAGEIHENSGFVDKFNLTDAGAERWLRAGFSNHTDVMAHQESWSVLDSKGYIFPIKYPRVDGFRWNDDHACVPIVVNPDGTMNEAYARFGETADAAVLTCYSALIPRVKSPQPVDPSSGKLPTAVVADFKQVAERRIDFDLGENKPDGTPNISGREVIVDKESNLLPPVQRLDMAVKVVPYGSADKIKVNLTLNNSLQ